MNGSFRFDFKKVKENTQTVDDTLCLDSNRRPKKNAQIQRWTEELHGSSRESTHGNLLLAQNDRVLKTTQSMKSTGI